MNFTKRIEELVPIVRNNNVSINNSASIIALFYSDRCPACPTAKKLLESVANNFNVYFINADTNPLATRLLVDRVPSIYGFKNRKPVARLDMEISRENIIKFWETLSSTMPQEQQLFVPLSSTSGGSYQITKSDERADQVRS